MCVLAENATFLPKKKQQLIRGLMTGRQAGRQAGRQKKTVVMRDSERSELAGWREKSFRAIVFNSFVLPRSTVVQEEEEEEDCSVLL